MPNNPLHLILTVDYELFGDGSGAVFPCVRLPATKMAQVAERYSAPLTFFVEALEFMEMEKITEYREEASLVKEQLLALLSKGHDVQLHIHPQWSKGFSVGRDWAKESLTWRMGDLDGDTALHLLSQGKMWLEKLAKQVCPAYRCIAFRAGGWAIQPSIKVLRALSELHFLIDSTVAPGQSNLVGREWFDFRDSPQRSYWIVHEDVCTEEGDGILQELPIATANIGRLRHAKALVSSHRVWGRGLTPGCAGSYAGPNGWPARLYGKLTKLNSLGKMMLDFSNFPAEVLIDATRQWRSRFEKDCQAVPLVAIAHTKTFTQESVTTLELYLRWAKDENITFSTYDKWLAVSRD